MLLSYFSLTFGSGLFAISVGCIYSGQTMVFGFTLATFVVGSIVAILELRLISTYKYAISVRFGVYLLLDVVSQRRNGVVGGGRQS